MRRMMLLVAAAVAAAVASARPPNYDEDKIAPYRLEDPLAFADGTKLTSADEWPKRRAEIVGIFEREMFGRTPPKPEAVVTELREEGPTLAGQAIRRQYRMWFKSDRSGPFIDWLVVIPNRINGNEPVVKDGKVVCENSVRVPVVLMLNYRGNQELLTDPEVFMPEGAWVRDHAERFCFGNRPARWTRGMARETDCASPMPVETLVARGYALVTACYGQVSPDVEVRKGDPEELAYTGVFALWPKRDPQATDNVTAIGAWAWALSRGLDLAETIPEIDARRSVATGCSRLAKTPLLACSRDERFAVCVPCQTGGGGCPLAKRDYGENVSTMMASFPHWYCRAYRKYIDNEQAMPFDQHLLIASIAPRAILIEGFNSGWFDTKGEYLAARAASPVWTFLGKDAMPDVPFPDNYSTAAVGPCLGYVRRGGQHGISGSDWLWMLDFADRVLGKPDPVDALVFYYPHWHVYPRGEQWFGKGWTEWEFVKTQVPRYPGHPVPIKPLMGYYDESKPENVEKEIDLAADAGIGAFLFDWYCYDGEVIMEEALERGFLKAKNLSRMKFALMWCYHDRYNRFRAAIDDVPGKLLIGRAGTPDEFRTCMDIVIDRFLGHPQYYRKDGHPFYSIFNAPDFVKRMGGPAAARRLLEEVDAKVAAKGLPSIHWNGIQVKAAQVAEMKAAGFHSCAVYNVTCAHLPDYSKRYLSGEQVFEYKDVADAHRRRWAEYDATDLPYLPTVTRGWDCSGRCRNDEPMPWKSGAYPYGGIVRNNDVETFRRLLADAKARVEADPKKPGIILLNAWNEYTEGCWLVPDENIGDASLRAVRSVMAPKEAGK